MTERLPQDEPVFAISVVARMVGLHQQTLRSYERIGLVRPARSAGNTRLYSQRDVERLRQVMRLVNDLGVNLAGVDVILRMGRQIEELQRQVDELQEQLEAARRENEQLRQEAGDGTAESRTRRRS